MKKLNARLIERYLELLGEELADFGVERTVRVMLLGGAFMLTQTSARRTTEDIDVLPLDGGEEGDEEAELALRNAVREIARKRRLDLRWFNWSIADFIRAAGDIPTTILWRKYGPLEVYLPPKEYIFVLKLLASRRKDELDITELCDTLNVHTREQAQQLVDTYIPDKEVQYFCELHLKLDKLFSSQEGDIIGVE